MPKAESLGSSRWLRHHSIEILPEVARFGAANLAATGYGNVRLRVGDGYLGWPEAAPFDGIIVTCAPDHIPEPLKEQLAEGGRFVIPVGEQGDQELVVIVKERGRLVTRAAVPVLFVPMTGIAEGGPAAAREFTGVTPRDELMRQRRR